LVLGAVIWLGAFLTRGEKARTREIADGLLIAGTLCLAAALIIEYVSLILALVMLGAAGILAGIWIFRAVRIFFGWPVKGICPEGVPNADPVSPQITDTTTKNEHGQGRSGEKFCEKNEEEDRQCPVTDTAEANKAPELNSDHQSTLSSADRDQRAFVLLVAAAIGIAAAGWCSLRRRKCPSLLNTRPDDR
jgi:hypothetical protein